MAVAVGVLAVAVGVLAVLVFGLLRTHAEILRALHRLGAGLDGETASYGAEHGGLRGPAPAAAGRKARDIVGTRPGGGPAKVSVIGAGRVTLLAFLSSGCRTCRSFWEAFASPDLAMPVPGTRLVIVGQDPAHDSESALAALVPSGVKAVLSSAAWQDYDVPGSPYFVLVDGAASAVIGAGTATDWEQMRGLLGQAVADDAMPSRKRKGRFGASGRRRGRRADEALRSSGVGPGHPSLHPEDPGHRSLHPDGASNEGSAPADGPSDDFSDGAAGSSHL